MKLLTNLAVEKLELLNFQLSGASFLAQDNIDGEKKISPKSPSLKRTANVFLLKLVSCSDVISSLWDDFDSCHG